MPTTKKQGYVFESSHVPIGIPFILVLAWGLARIVFFSFLILLSVGLVVEGVLRVNGQKPTNLEAAGLSATVQDLYTGWRMRPNVKHGPEFIWTNKYGVQTPPMNMTSLSLQDALVSASLGRQ